MKRHWSGDVSGYREPLVKFVESQGIALIHSEQIAPAKGLSHGGKITLLTGMQPRGRICDAGARDRP